MWVFDGEEWTDEGATESTRTPEPALPRYDGTTPELQVIEHVPTPAVRIHYDYVPLPTP